MNLPSFELVAGERIHQPDHHWVVCPDATISEKSAAVLVHRKVSGCGGSRHRDRDHLLAPVALIIFVVRRLENIDFGEAVECWNAKASLRVPYKDWAENLLQMSQKFVRVIGMMPQASHEPQSGSYPKQVKTVRGKDFP